MAQLSDSSTVTLEEGEVDEEDQGPSLPYRSIINRVAAFLAHDGEDRVIPDDVVSVAPTARSDDEDVPDEAIEDEDITDEYPLKEEPETSFDGGIPAPVPEAQSFTRPERVMQVPSPAIEAQPHWTGQGNRPFARVMGGEGSGQRGRPMGHSNAWVFYNLLYLARHGHVVDGTPSRMVDYYKSHPKLSMAKGVVKKEREGKHVDYSPYFKNLGSTPSTARVRRKS